MMSFCLMVFESKTNGRSSINAAELATAGQFYRRGARICPQDSAAPGSTIYYTLDGTDPRATGAPTNAVSASLSASAREYTGPIIIDASTRLVARAYNPRHNNLTGKSNPPITSHWSGPRKAVYSVGKPNR